MGVAPLASETAFDRSVRERMAIEAETWRLGELRSLTPLGPVWGIFGLVYRLAKWGENSPRVSPVLDGHRPSGPVLRKRATVTRG
jgi:hypothetical protein